MALITRLRFHDLRYGCLSLRSALSIRPGLSISMRETLILRYQDQDGRIWSGECPPLPGVHKESLQEAGQIILELTRGKLQEIEIDSEQPVALNKPYFGLLDAPAPASVLFAYEQILWQLLFQVYPQSNFIARLPVKWEGQIAGLLHLNAEHIPHSLNQLLEQNIEVVKVKVGRQKFAKELQILERFVKLSQGRIRFRIDANQSLQLEDLKDLASAIPTELIEFVEEPFTQVSPDWQSYQGPLPLARDESLWDIQADSMQPTPYPLKLVIKPSRLGISGTAAWLETLPNPASELILSASYESGWSLALMLQMAAYFDLKAALGFGTYEYLLEDLLVTRLNIRTGPVKLDTKLPDMDEHRLSQCLPWL